MIGDDYANVPPAQALAKKGHCAEHHRIQHLRRLFEESPPAALIDAVVRGEIDVAIAGGPLAGYFAKRASVPLKIVPVSPEVDPPSLPFVFDISLGVRKEDKALLGDLDGALERRKKEIDRLLRDYGVPLKSNNRSSGGPSEVM